jgi:hypothetical protein
MLSMPDLVEQRHGIELRLHRPKLRAYFLRRSCVCQKSLTRRRWSIIASPHQRAVTAFLNQLE